MHQLSSNKNLEVFSKAENAVLSRQGVSHPSTLAPRSQVMVLLVGKMKQM